jgi:plastocyanin
MKKIILIIAVAAAVAVVPGSTAATHQVSITPTGFVPSTLTIAVGDTVTWTNTDTRNRRVASTDAPFTSPILAPTQTFSFTFTKAGRYRYEDPTVQPRQRGTIVVRVGAPTVTIAAQPKTVRYGRSTLLSGKVSSGRAGERVTIATKRCRDNAFARIGDTTTTTDGVWTFTTKPLDRTTYRAQFGAATSEVAVRVRPRLSLAKLAAHKYRVRVFAAESFAGKSVFFQRWNATRRAWVRVKSVTLTDTGLGVAPTVISGRDFRSRIAAGKRVRVSMSGLVAGTCYVANTSGVIRS